MPNKWSNRRWEDKSTYLFPLNQNMFHSGTAEIFIPLVGNSGESASSTGGNVQFIPPNNGRLLSITCRSSNSTAPGGTFIKLYQNGGPGEIGRKFVSIQSETVQTFDFTSGLVSGTNEWNVDDGSSLAISIDTTNTPDDFGFYVLFEIDL
jgi:hypothetical protein